MKTTSSIWNETLNELVTQKYNFQFLVLQETQRYKA